MSNIEDRIAAVAVQMIVDGDPLAPTLFRFLTGQEMPASWRPAPRPAPRIEPDPIAVPGELAFCCSAPGCEVTEQIAGHSLGEVDAAARAAGWRVGPELDLCPEHARSL